MNLNSSRSDKETIHLALAFDGAAPAYEPGDSLDLYAENDPATVDELLKLAGLSGDDKLRAELIKSRDVTTLSLKTVETYAAQTGHQYVKALLADGQAKDWIAGRQLIDLIAMFPIALTADHLRAVTRPLGAARLFDRLVAPRSRRGSASVDFRRALRDARPRAQGRRLQLRRRAAQARRPCPRQAQAQQAFRACRPPTRTSSWSAPAPASRRSAPSCRSAAPRKATGKSWLFFGDRQFTHDFLYQLDWQEALKDGALTRMDVAFSRDTPEKVYVQHKLWDKRRELIEWLDGGAHFYVCGDAKHMAKDVRAALVRAYAEVKALAPEAAEQAVATLERDKRYLQDTY